MHREICSPQAGHGKRAALIAAIVTPQETHCRAVSVSLMAPRSIGDRLKDSSYPCKLWTVRIGVIHGYRPVGIPPDTGLFPFGTCIIAVAYRIQYYDLVLIAIAVSMTAGGLLGWTTTLPITTTVPLMSLLAVGLIGHALFISGPVETVDDLGEEVDPDDVRELVPVPNVGDQRQ